MPSVKHGTKCWGDGYRTAFIPDAFDERGSVRIPVEGQPRDPKQEEKEMIAAILAIPDILQLVQKFIYKQLKDNKNTLPDVPSTKVDDYIRGLLKEKSPLFFKAMETLGHNFTSFQQEHLLTFFFEESRPFREEITQILRAREEEERARKEREELQRRVEEQKKATQAAFGEEITNIQTVTQIEELKPVGETIDALLKQYEEWERKPLEKNTKA